LLLLPDPDNSALFRDIKKVGQRKVITSEPHYKVVEVEQVGEIKVRGIQRDGVRGCWERGPMPQSGPCCRRQDVCNGGALIQCSTAEAHEVDAGQ
jgi:hypothetical protein